MYFLIGIWGGPNREYASIKFLPVHVARIDLHLVDHHRTLHISRHVCIDRPVCCFPSIHFFCRSAVVYSWMAGAQLGVCSFIDRLRHQTADGSCPHVATRRTRGGIDANISCLAALLLKIGGYGLLRTAYPLFPDSAVAMSFAVSFIGMLSIIYGAMNALASKDFKRLIAYSSVSHMGFVLLGVASATTEGISGAVYQMTSHGLISAMLFVIAGVIYDRTHDRMIANYSGLASKMPVYTTFVLVGFFAALGLPGLSGFVGEIMVFIGAFQSNLVADWVAFLSVGGLIFGAGYCLWTIQRMFFGAYAVKGEVVMNDVDGREKLMLLPLAILIILLGVLPQLC